MNRKLRNTILAFSVSGLVLAVGLMSARPLATDAAAPSGMTARVQPAGAHPATVPVEQAAAAAADALAARIEARSLRFEADLARTASIDAALATTAGFVAGTTADAVLTGLLGEGAQEDAKATHEPSPHRPARKSRGVRGTIAVPFFSFARGTGRGDRS